MKPTLVFVYNADGGLFNGLADLAHKTFSPQTYACNLCSLTYFYFGMKKDWKEFLGSLDLPLEFLHRDEFQACYGREDISLPAIFKKNGNELEMWIDADAIKACRNIGDLKQHILNALAQSK
jgi:hypothetical protein